jgi:hypothetical protein
MPVLALGGAPRRTGPRVRGRAAWSVMLGLAVAVVPSPAMAESLAPTIAVVPGSVTLRTGEEAELDVLVVNPTATPVSITSIEVAPTPGITAEVSLGDDATVPVASGGSVVAALTVTPTREVTDAQVGLVLHTRPAPDGSLAQVATTTLTISTAAASAPVLTFLVAPDSLNDGEDRPTTVRIDNSAGPEISRVTLEAVNGEDVSIGRPQNGTDTCGAAGGLYCVDTLAAGASVLVQLETVAAASVHTGTQQVGLILTASPGPGLPAVTATATQDVELTVFGVDALSPFGIGTLFVLPGLLAVVLFLLGNTVYPQTKALPDQADIKDLRQFPAVVGVSALVYVVAWVGLKQDLTGAVSTGTVALMAAGGAGIGLLAWVILALTYAHTVGRKVFRVTDTPRRALTRLKARGGSLSVPGFTIGGLQYARLAPAAGGKVYASPRIAYEFTETGASDTQARQNLANEIDRGEIDALLRAETAGTVTLSWAQLDGVRTVDEAAAVVTATIRLPEEKVGVQQNGQ